MNNLIQIFILLLSSLSIYFLSRTDSKHKYGLYFGLASQPFWLYQTLTLDQWAMFTVSVWYTYCFGKGVYEMGR